MSLEALKEKWVAVVKNMNEKGFPMPTIRDPKSGLGSVSLTLVFVSFNFCLIAMIGKWAGKLGGVDPSQALNLFMVCAGLYWGRKFQKDEKGGASIDSSNSSTEPKIEEVKPNEVLPG